MKIEVGAKIHNKYYIEVRNVKTNTITKRGYAENIVLKNFLTDISVFYSLPYASFGYAILFGSGTGTLNASRTTLFKKEGLKVADLHEKSFNQIPNVSYCTKKIVLNPSEYIGVKITEVGVGASNNESSTLILTHALIKDSEGNDLTLGPKTADEEVTIYSTIFANVTLEDGVTLINPSNNSLLSALTGYGETEILKAGTSKLYVGNEYSLTGTSTKTSGKITSNGLVFTTNQVNKKVKILDYKGAIAGIARADMFSFNLETLAENESAIWGGHQFQNKLVAVGDGVTKIFNLPWDEAWLTKTKKVYVDGVAKTSGVTWTDSTLIFDNAPLINLNITADYWIKYIPKDNSHEIRATIIINFGEGTPI